MSILLIKDICFQQKKKNRYSNHSIHYCFLILVPNPKYKLLKTIFKPYNIDCLKIEKENGNNLNPKFPQFVFRLDLENAKLWQLNHLSCFFLDKSKEAKFPFHSKP